jgi:hypothetical protein
MNRNCSKSKSDVGNLRLEASFVAPPSVIGGSGDSLDASEVRHTIIYRTLCTFRFSLTFGCIDKSSGSRICGEHV